MGDKGKNAYYFAHCRHFEIPEDAQIISRPGLLTGGAPEFLEKSDTLLTEEDKIAWIQEYSWADFGAKVKIGIPCECVGVAATEDMVTVKFEKNSLMLEVATQPLRKLRL